MKNIVQHRNTSTRTAMTLALAALAMAGLALTGCNVDFTPPPANPPASNLGLDASATVSTTGTPAETPAGGASTGSTASVGASGTSLPGTEPGVARDASGAGTVRGTLLHKDIEGGVYVIVDSRPGAGADTAATLAVISNGDAFPLASMKGTYVEAQGAIDEGTATTSMAGPPIAITRIVAAK